MAYQDYRVRAQFPPGKSDLTNSTSFSGTDCSVIFIVPSISNAITPGLSTMDGSQMQTLTISSATSVLPVRTLGRSKPRGYNKGGRTFAGSMVFSVLAVDPFQRIMNVDALSNTVRGDGHWWIDQMAPFDAVIVCTNEMGESGIQAIFDITLTNWGTTYSVEDLYIESTYTYVAEHVTPFISKKFDTIKDAIDELEVLMSTTDIAPDLATANILNRRRGEIEDIYGTNSPEFFGLFRMGDIKRQDLTQYENLPFFQFAKPGSISVIEKYNQIFFNSPELPGNL